MGPMFGVASGVGVVKLVLGNTDWKILSCRLAVLDTTAAVIVYTYDAKSSIWDRPGLGRMYQEAR